MTDIPPSPPTPRGPTPSGLSRGRWVRTVLVLSLALNFAVAGMVVGSVLNRGGKGPRGDVVRDLGFGPFTEALSDEDRAALRQAFIEQRSEGRLDRRALRAEARTLLATLRSEPYDEKAAAAAIAALNNRNAARVDLGQRLILARIAQMSPEDRAGFADRLERVLTRRGGPRPEVPGRP